MSRVFGWAPTNGDEYVEIPHRPDPPRPGFFNFQTSRSTESSATRPSSPAVSSPASSNSSLSLEGGFQSEPYPEPVRRGDPSWVPRPRNPFIIFRCEYSRLHSKDNGKRVRRPPGSQVEKSLSKKAAEAWHLLPEEGKNRYKELAEQEKEEHARMYPGYIFRPQKREKGIVKKKPTSVSRSNSISLAAPLPREAAVLAPTPRYPPQSAAPPPTPPLPPPPAPADMAAVKAHRRRSASVPSLPVGQYPFIAQWVSQAPRLEMKRSRSVMANRPAPRPVTNPASPYVGPSFDPRLLQSPSPGYYTPEESFGTVHPAMLGEFPFPDHLSTSSTPAHLSPLTQALPALSMWNGETMGMDSSASWASPAMEFDAHSVPYPEYANHQDSALVDFSSNDPWAAPPTYPLTMDTVNSLDESGVLFLPANAYDTPVDSPYALQDYGQAVDPNAIQNPEDAMFTLAINDSNIFEQPHSEDYYV